MDNYNEESYERYKQYRLNKYRYEQAQKLPLIFLVLLAMLSTIFKYIIWGIIAFVIVFFCIDLYKVYRKKEMSVKQTIKLKSNDALKGTEIELYIKNLEVPLTIVVKIPPKTKNGQKFVLRNVRTKKSSGRIVKKDIYLTIEIR